MRWLLICLGILSTVLIGTAVWHHSHSKRYGLAILRDAHPAHLTPSEEREWAYNAIFHCYEGSVGTECKYIVGHYEIKRDYDWVVTAAINQLGKAKQHSSTYTKWDFADGTRIEIEDISRLGLKRGAPAPKQRVLVTIFADTTLSPSETLWQRIENLL